MDEVRFITCDPNLGFWSCQVIVVSEFGKVNLLLFSELEELFVLLLCAVELLHWVGRHFVVVSIYVSLVSQPKKELSPDLEGFLAFILPGFTPLVLSIL